MQRQSMYADKCHLTRSLTRESQTNSLKCMCVKNILHYLN